jgi:flagellar motility protein MotE (MotC chaperone)
MKRFVLPALIWMLALKLILVGGYLAGSFSALSSDSKKTLENETLAVSGVSRPAGYPALSLVTPANAADAVNAAAAVAAEDTKETAAPVPDEDKSTKPDQAVAFLAEERALLAEREAYLERKEARLLELQEEISEKIEALTQLRENILTAVDQRNEIHEAEVRHLIKIYSTMKPQKVAQLIEKLDLALVTELFSRMKGDVVGDILSFVDTETGARITQGLFPESVPSDAAP